MDWRVAERAARYGEPGVLSTAPSTAPLGTPPGGSSMRMRFGSRMWVVASALLVAACGGTDEAKHGVAEFRSRAAQKSYGEIYRTAGAELRQTATEEQFERFMTTLDRRLGTWQSAAEPAWNVTRGNGGPPREAHLPVAVRQGRGERAVRLANANRWTGAARLPRQLAAVDRAVTRR